VVLVTLAVFQEKQTIFDLRVLEHVLQEVGGGFAEPLLFRSSWYWRTLDSLAETALQGTKCITAIGRYRIKNRPLETWPACAK
jgi:hypothetical protein